MYTVQCTTSKVSKQVVIYNFFYAHIKVYNILYLYFKEADPNTHRSWYELGNIVGKDVLSESEVDAEVEKTKEDEEVERIYKDAKEKHRRMMTGTV